jgi:hypothetical protein
MIFSVNRDYFPTQQKSTDLYNGSVVLQTEFLNIIYTSFSFKGLNISTEMIASHVVHHN